MKEKLGPDDFRAKDNQGRIRSENEAIIITSRRRYNYMQIAPARLDTYSKRK